MSFVRIHAEVWTAPMMMMMMHRGNVTDSRISRSNCRSLALGCQMSTQLRHAQKKGKRKWSHKQQNTQTLADNVIQFEGTKPLVPPWPRTTTILHVPTISAHVARKYRKQIGKNEKPATYIFFLQPDRLGGLIKLSFRDRATL